MQMRVERLRETLKLLGPAVPGKPTLPILKNILLREGKAVSTDLENTIVIDFPEATEHCLLPYREINELLDITPGNLDVNIEAVKGTVKLTWPGGKASYPVAKVSEYPDVDNKPVPELTAEVDGTALVEGLTEVAPYAATDGSRPVLNGVTIYLGEKVSLAAADAFRLVYRVLPFSFGEKGTVIIPLNTVKLLAHLWKHTPVVAQVKGSFIERALARRLLTLAVGT